MPDKRGYIFLGATEESTELAVPYPSVGSAAFSSEEPMSGENNANGVYVSQAIGETRFRQEIGWERIEAEKWWELSSFLEDCGSEVFCRFFNHMTGKWQVKKFLWSGRACSPVMVDVETGKPKYYRDAGFTLESIGE